jgi:hypothetical protein
MKHECKLCKKRIKALEPYWPLDGFGIVHKSCLEVASAAQPAKRAAKPKLATRLVGSTKSGLAALVKSFKAIAKKKHALAKSAARKGQRFTFFRASGIASAFDYCAMRLEYELAANAHRAGERAGRANDGLEPSGVNHPKPQDTK